MLNDVFAAWSCYKRTFAPSGGAELSAVMAAGRCSELFEVLIVEVAAPRRKRKTSNAPSCEQLEEFHAYRKKGEVLGRSIRFIGRGSGGGLDFAKGGSWPTVQRAKARERARRLDR